MYKRLDYNLSKKQKEAIAEQLASFFFDFWNNRNIKPTNRSSKAVALDSGLLRNFPEPPKATT
jgi:hypothetical protein